MALIEVKAVSHSFSTGQEKIEVLKGIEFSVNEGEIVTIQGRSGSGKSTLLNLMSGFMKPTMGSVVVNGMKLEEMNENQLSKYRRETIGFIFQTFHLFPNMSVLDNVAEPLFYKGVRKKERLAKAKEILERVGLGDRIQYPPHQLSGGQQQRVCIARALVGEPTIIFADEPTGNLDSETEEDILKMMLTINKEFGKTLVIVTHDDKVAQLADRQMLISDGRLVEKDIVWN